MGKIETDHTGSGGGITLSSDGTSLLLDGTAVGGGGGGGTDLQTTENLVNGDLVALNSAGTVSKMSAAFSAGATNTVATTGTMYIENSTVATDGSGTFVTMWRGLNSYPFVVAHTVSGTTITTGTPVSLVSLGVYDSMAIIYDTAQQKYLAIAPFNGSVQAFVISVSGTTITAQTGTTAPGGTGWSGDYDASQSKGVFLYRNSSNNDPYVVATTISGTSVSFNTPAIVQNISYAYTFDINYNSTAQKSVAFYTDDTGTTAYATVIGLSGSTFTIGSPATVAVGDKGGSFSIHGQSSVAFLYRYRGASSSLEARARVASISGTTLTLGAEVSLSSTRSDYNWGFYDSGIGKIFFGYQDGDPPTYRLATLSGTTITLETPATLSSLGSLVYSQKIVSKNASGNRMVQTKANSPASIIAFMLSFESNIDDFIGIAGETIAASATGKIEILSDVNTGQSGLTTGSKYYLQADGTLGTTVVAEAAVGLALSSTDLLITYDPADNLNYTDADVDTHLNTSTATTGEFLSWSGTDYDWIAAGGGGADLYVANTTGSTDPTASGTLGLAIGSSASASGSSSVAIGNTALANSPYSVAIGYQADGSETAAIAMGFQATATGYYSTSIGPNASAFQYGAALGKDAVTSTNQYATALTRSRATGVDSLSAAIGNNTTTYGSDSTGSVSLGLYARARNTRAYAIGGYASASYSIAIGNDSMASQVNSIALGKGARANVIGKLAFSNGYFGGQGDAQGGQYILLGYSTNATPEVLTTDNGNTGVWYNSVYAPDGAAIAFDGTVVARLKVSEGTAYSAWRIEGLLVNTNNTTTLVNSAITIIDNQSNWGMALTANNSANALAITGTGEAAKSIRWVANIRTSELEYR